MTQRDLTQTLQGLVRRPRNKFGIATVSPTYKLHRINILLP